MLKKGFKDEAQQKINQMLHIGLQLSFVPEKWNLEEKKRVDQILMQTTSLNLSNLLGLSESELLKHLEAKTFDYTNLENLADLLLKIAEVEKDKTSVLARKALLLYDFAQRKGSIFSFSMARKMKKAEKFS